MEMPNIRMGVLGSSSVDALWRGQWLVVCILGVSIDQAILKNYCLQWRMQDSGFTISSLLLQPILAPTSKVPRTQESGTHTVLDNETMAQW